MGRKEEHFLPIAYLLPAPVVIQKGVYSMLRFRRFLLLCVFCLPIAFAAIGCEEKREVYKEKTVEPHVIKKDFIVE